MSIFPTKILLATDGSEDAQLAATTSVDLSKRLDSELHVVYVRHVLDPGFESRMHEHAGEAAKNKLEEQVQKMKEASSEVTQAHARVGLPSAEILRLAEELGVGLIVMVERPKRRQRSSRRNVKSDPFDAESAARAVLAGETSGVPKSADGCVQMIRALRAEIESGRPKVSTSKCRFRPLTFLWVS